MANIFDKIKLMRPKKNFFDLSHPFKLTCNAGELVPVLCMDCIPGDKVSVGHDALIRMAPMLAPMMHQVNIYFHSWFVPTRLVWPGWEKWIVQNPDAEAFPYVHIDPVEWDRSPIGLYRLANYLGIPAPTTDVAQTVAEKVSAVPFAVYQFIYDMCYRDQNLQQEVNYLLTAGDNDLNADLLAMRRRAWEHDYFTSGLPWAQKGDPVDIPLGTLDDMPVKYNKLTGDASYVSTSLDAVNIETDQSATLPSDVDLYADAENAILNPGTINDLRTALMIQAWKEINARAGTRYTEHIFGHFGVRSSDKRLQRPEYIGGTRSPMVISEVLNTTGDTGSNDLPQGNMSGHGVSVAAGKNGVYFCEEHGYVMTLMSIMPKSAYQNGIPKHFLKYDDPYQYYYPKFAHLGEQEILNRELYAYRAEGGDPFAYTPRYAEYKYMSSRVAGEFVDTLDFWQWGRKFDSLPVLSGEFIECNPDNSIFSVVSETDKFYCQVNNKLKATRPMPFFGTPGLAGI